MVRHGGIPLPIFSEWWLAKEKFSFIDSFILSSFPGATFQGCNGLSVKYQNFFILFPGFCFCLRACFASSAKAKDER
nr:abc transporter a family member 1 [Quercus suber]